MAIEIDLRNYQTRIISLADDAGKRASATALCQNLDLSFDIVDAIKCSPGAIGCGLSHLKVLRAAEDGPVLVLEDDVAKSDGYSPTLTVPDDADAVWLGTSAFGSVTAVNHVGYTHLQLAEEAEYGLVRIHNLLSSHAILHLTDRWRRAACEAMTSAMVDCGWPPDRGLALIQSDFKVYAVREPFFHQAGQLQPEGREIVEEWTRVPLRPTKLDTRALIETRSGPREVKVVRTARGLEWNWA
jgi:hypothetical protein